MIIRPRPGNCSNLINDAVERALNGGDPAMTARQAVDSVYLSAGRYQLDAPVKIRSAQGLKFTGAGGATILQPTFDGTAAVDADGCCRCTFADMWICGNGKEELLYGLWHRWSGAVRRSSSTCTFRNIFILNTRYRTGFQVGHPGLSNQCDQARLYDCEASGQWSPGEISLWQKGFCFGSGAWGNNVGHHAYALSASRHARNVSVEASQLSLYGCDFGHGGVDLYADTNGYFVVGGLRSEGSQRLLQTGGPASSPANVTLGNIDFHAEQLASDGIWIDYQYGGTLCLLGQVSIASAPRTPKIHLHTAAPAKLVAIGLTALGGYTLADMLDCGKLASHQVLGFTSVVGGHVVSVD